MPPAIANRPATDDLAFLARVEQELVATLAGAEQSMLDAAVPELRALVEPLGQLVLAGGKRIRPAFCYWGWRGAIGDGDATGTGYQNVVRAGAALELLHSCALVHDDLMDGSDVRRGRPSLHRALAHWHAEQGLAGDPEAFGRSGALLAGHLCLVWADRLIDELPPGRSRRARSLCRQLRTEMAAGQYLDLMPGAGSVDACLRLAELKTGRYTVERPLQMGAVVGDGGGRLLDTYHRYGRPLGVAFQLVDDLADLFGAPGEAGPPGGDDLRAGRVTALLATARRLADPCQRDRLDRVVGRADVDETELAGVRDVLVASGAVEVVEGLIAARVAEAEAAVGSGDLPPATADALLGLAESVRRAARDSQASGQTELDGSRHPGPAREHVVSVGLDPVEDLGVEDPGAAHAAGGRGRQQPDPPVGRGVVAAGPGHLVGQQPPPRGGHPALR